MANKFKVGDNVWYLYSTICNARLLKRVVVKVNKSSLKLGVLQEDGSISFQENINKKKIAAENEKFCIVCNTIKNPNGGYSYRMEKEMYPEMHKSGYRDEEEFVLETNITYVRHAKEGVFHKTRGPAFIAYDNNKVVEKKFYVKGKLHNTKGPAVESNYDNWLVKKYYIDGKLHNTNGPAEVHFYQNGNSYVEDYYINGVLHNTNSPAKNRYYFDGNKRSSHYYLNGKLHNTKGAADIYYRENGSIDIEIYYIDGVIHNDNGPAFIMYYKNGNVMFEYYYTNGVCDKTKTNCYNESGKKISEKQFMKKSCCQNNVAK